MVGKKDGKKTTKEKTKKTPITNVKIQEKVAGANALVTKTKSKAGKKKANLLKLCTEMNKLAIDAVDREVIKRFRILIDAAEEDITKTGLSAILKDWKEIDLSQFHESFHPYIKHYIFMMKRKQIKK
ncbi:MAG: hypothetical protein N2316_13515 [Spirochaetes bacterium]|nr:hypothetical protein [Spirochaetota bacterium]